MSKIVSYINSIEFTLARNAVVSITNTIFYPLIIVFLVLKVFNFINWSWWIVLSPLWGGFIFNIIATVFVVRFYYGGKS